MAESRALAAGWNARGESLRFRRRDRPRDEFWLGIFRLHRHAGVGRGGLEMREVIVTKKTKPHLVWHVSVGSRDDEKLGDRFYYDGHRALSVFKLPVRASYLIETRAGGIVAVNKALRLARHDGISNPIELGWGLANDERPPAPENHDES